MKRATKSAGGRFGAHAGSRPGRAQPPSSGFEGRPALLELEDLWAMADRDRKPRPAMTLNEMNAAKVRKPNRRGAKVKLLK